MSLGLLCLHITTHVLVMAILQVLQMSLHHCQALTGSHLQLERCSMGVGPPVLVPLQFLFLVVACMLHGLQLPAVSVAVRLENETYFPSQQGWVLCPPVCLCAMPSRCCCCLRLSFRLAAGHVSSSHVSLRQIFALLDLRLLQLPASLI